MREWSAFPFETLPVVPRADATLLKRAARRLPAADSEAWRERSEQLLGTTVQIQPYGRVDLNGTAAAGLRLGVRDEVDPAVAIVIEAPRPRAQIVFEVEPRLAACVVHRILGGEAGEAVPLPLAPLGDVERGVLAYFAAQLLQDGPFRLRTVVTGRAARKAIDGMRSAVWPVLTTVGEDQGMVWAHLPEEALHYAPAQSQRGSRFAALPITLVVEAGRGILTGQEIATLHLGDVVLFDANELQPGLNSAAAMAPAGEDWTGEVSLRALGGRRTRWRCRYSAAGLTIQAVDRFEDLSVKEARTMNPSKSDKALELVGETPLELAVELARFRLPLEEVAELREGEVISTGNLLGERVALRAGDRSIATGELVAVDGEVGFRVLSLATSSTMSRR